MRKVFEQGDEEGQHRPGVKHGGQEAEELAGHCGGPGPDGERRSGAPQSHRNDSHKHTHIPANTGHVVMLSSTLVHLVAFARKAARSWNRTSSYSAPLLRVCCTDMER